MYVQAAGFITGGSIYCVIFQRILKYQEGHSYCRIIIILLYYIFVMVARFDSNIREYVSCTVMLTIIFYRFIQSVIIIRVSYLILWDLML